ERDRIRVFRPLGAIRRLKLVVLSEQLTTLFREAPNHRAVLFDCAVQLAELVRKFCRLSDVLELRLKLAEHPLNDFLSSTAQPPLLLCRGYGSQGGVVFARKE